MGRIDKYIQFVRGVCADNSHGYSQVNRWGPDYDCSSLQISALNYAYGTAYTSGYTGTMRSQFEAVGWTWHPYHGDPTPVPVGAVMLNITHHTECVVDWDHLAGAHMDEVGDIVGRIAGDQTGAEISVVPWYEYWDGWDGWLEPPADNVPVPAAPAPTPSGTKDLETVAMEVKAGLWGNNPERAEALKAAGYDYPTVQQRVNETIANSNVNSGNVAPAPDLDPIAWMIIRGQGGYGNNPERAERLTRDGYDAAAVQQRVNQLLS